MTLKKYLSCLFFLSVFLISTGAYGNSPLQINSESFVLMDLDTGIILHSENMDKKIYPASTTKIMTAVVALENLEVETIMTASTEAVNDIGVGGMNIGIMSGEEMTLYDLLHGLLLPSANEAANIIAENTAPSRQDFFIMMNKKALSLGLKNTNFVNANGLHNVDHYTTAGDMAHIAREAMKYDVFRQIVGKKSYELPPTNKHSEWDPIYNSNKLLRFGPSFEAEFEIEGIKTGFTTPAGHNLVAAARGRDGMNLITVIHGVKEDNSWETIYTYSENLLKYGFDNFSRNCILEKNTVVTTLVPENGEDDEILALVCENPVYLVHGEGIEYIRKIILDPLVEAPVDKGEKIGRIEFYFGDTLVAKEDLIALNSVDEKIAEPFLTGFSVEKAVKIVAFFLSFFFLLRIILKFLSKRYRKKKKRYSL